MRYVQVLDPETGRYTLVPKDEHMQRTDQPFAIIRVPDHVTDHITGEPVRITSWRQHDRLCREHNVTPKYGKGWV